MQAVVALKAIYPVTVLLEVAHLPSSTYYVHVTRLDRPDPYADLRARITTIFHAAHGRYGHRRIHACVRAEGHVVAKKTILNLMRDAQLVCVIRRTRKRRPAGAMGAIAPNLLARDYRVTAPNQKWVTDITEFHVPERRVYLTAMMDVFDRQVLAYGIATSPSVAWTNAVLHQALATLQPGETPLVHSDQGFQYRHASWLQVLAEAGAQPSMSRAGTCLDNALMENFFGHLKAEMFHHTTFSDIDVLITTIHEYIAWYNTKRISLTLGGRSPVQYRAHALAIQGGDTRESD